MAELKLTDLCARRLMQLDATLSMEAGLIIRSSLSLSLPLSIYAISLKLLNMSSSRLQLQLFLFQMSEEMVQGGLFI